MVGGTSFHSPGGRVGAGVGGGGLIATQYWVSTLSKSILFVDRRLRLGAFGLFSVAFS